MFTVPGSVMFNTATATLETGEPRCNGIGNTAWVKFTAPATATYTISTVGSDFDTVVAAYRTAATGTGFAPLSPVLPEFCNDDADGATTSKLQVSATAGEVITVQVGGYGSASGNVTLSIN